MKYQLVLQFTTNTLDSFDQLVALEEKLLDKLDNTAVVDGHDFGQSEFNVFILTDHPAAVFDKARQIVIDQRLQQGMRAAYRELTAENYVVLWPSTLVEFIVA